MPIFELDSGRPSLVEPMRPAAGTFDTDSTALVAEHLVSLLGEPLFPVATRPGTSDAPHMLAVDAAGQPVVVEVVQVLDMPGLTRALRYAGAAARMSSVDLARAYGAGPEQFAADLVAFRESVPVARAHAAARHGGARLVLVCSEVTENLVDAVEFLRQPGRQVEVLQLGVVRGADGRRYAEVSPLVPSRPARRPVEPSVLRVLPATGAQPVVPGGAGGPSSERVVGALAPNGTFPYVLPVPVGPVPAVAEPADPLSADTAPIQVVLERWVDVAGGTAMPADDGTTDAASGDAEAEIPQLDAYLDAAEVAAVAGVDADGEVTGPVAGAGAEGPAVDESAEDRSGGNPPIAERPTDDDSAADEPAVDEPAVDEPAVHEPAVHEPAVDEPAVDEGSDDGSTEDGRAGDRPTDDSTERESPEEPTASAPGAGAPGAPGKARAGDAPGEDAPGEEPGEPASGDAEAPVPELDAALDAAEAAAVGGEPAAMAVTDQQPVASAAAEPAAADPAADQPAVPDSPAAPGAESADAAPASELPGTSPARPAADPEPDPRLVTLAEGLGGTTTLVWRRLRRGQRFVAMLRRDGLLQLPDEGGVFADPDAAATAVADAEAPVDGWRAWRVGDGGPALVDAVEG